MAAGQLHTVLRQLRRLATTGEVARLSDAELLERFVQKRDEAAFELLVWRHGTMVLNLCRRILVHPHDADDAFQATFLALVRKASAIGKREALASWLYKVAYRVALRARGQTRKRNTRECDGVQLLAAPSKLGGEWSDLKPVLDEEVERLPQHYRVPVILCYLEGKTNAEAAELLGCPLGTIATRLSRARDLLRDRLTRRGVTLSAGALGLLLVEHAADAALPSALVASTVRTGLCFAAGKTLAAGSISANVVALTEGALHAMLLSKLKIAGVAVLVVGLLGTATGPITYQAIAQTGDGPTKAALAQKAQGGAKPQRESPVQQELEVLKASIAKLEAELAANEERQQRLQAEREVLKAHLRTALLQAPKTEDRLLMQLDELKQAAQAERERALAAEKKVQAELQRAIMEQAAVRQRFEVERAVHEQMAQRLQQVRQKLETVFKELEEAQKAAPAVNLQPVFQQLQEVYKSLPKEPQPTATPARQLPPAKQKQAWNERHLKMVQLARLRYAKSGNSESALREWTLVMSNTMKEWLALTDKEKRTPDEEIAVASLLNNLAKLQASQAKWQVAERVVQGDRKAGPNISENDKDIHRFQRESALLEWANAQEEALKEPVETRRGQSRRIEDQLYTRLRRDLAYNDAQASFAIWVKEVNGQRLVQPTIKRLDAQGREELVAQAAEATLEADEANGELRIHLTQGELSNDGGKKFSTFDKETVLVPLPMMD